jgi:FixJ family two-component response regulator
MTKLLSEQLVDLSTTDDQPVVFIIDDDEQVREPVADLLRSVGLGAQAFDSTQEFMPAKRPRVHRAGREIAGRERSGIPVHISWLKHSASGHIHHRPWRYCHVGESNQIRRRRVSNQTVARGQELLDAVPACIEQDGVRRQQAGLVAELGQRPNSLTSREREVLPLVITGRLNKEIAGQLDLSEVTVKVHRGQIMRKMRSRSLVDLVRMVDKLRTQPGKLWTTFLVRHKIEALISWSRPAFWLIWQRSNRYNPWSSRSERRPPQRTQPDLFPALR